MHSVTVELAPAHLGQLWGLPITNSLVTSWVVMAMLIIMAAVIYRKLSMAPSRFQLLLEALFEYAYDFAAETFESRELARRFFPLLITIFLFVFAANSIEFFPGIGSIGFYENGAFVPLLRSVNTDLNMTLSLTLISVITIELAGVATLGFFRYVSKFINFRGHSIGERLLNFIVGLIELVSEVSRLISFSFRLFGNIFAGEVLVAVITYFVPYMLPSVAIGFEMFVGFIQAVVFSMLTLFFLKLAVTDPYAAH